MERDLSSEEFYAAIGAMGKAMDAGFAQVNARLDKLNGKTERHGEDIAALKAVEDERERQREVREDEPTRSGKRDGAIGGAIAAGAVGMIELIRVLWK